MANRLLLFPHALTSLAIATAVFPRFARLGSAGDLDELRKTTDQATHHTLLVAVPAAAGMILVGAPLIDVMFASEQSSAADLATANLTTIYLVASLPAIGVAQLHARTLYALDDYRTPAWMSFWLLLLNLILNVVFVIWLSMGVPGLVLATTIAAYANAFGLRQAVKARCSTNADSPIKIIPIVLATAAMAAAVYGLLAAWETDSRLGQVIFDLAIPILAGMATYGLALYLFGQRNLRMR